MLKVQTILPIRAGASQAVSAPMFTRETTLAPEAVQAARLAVCERCQFNREGKCRQCCGGVPVDTMVRLNASRCGRHFWSV